MASILAVALLTAAQVGSDAPCAITVDSSVRHQTVEHFGASGAWWAQHVGGWEAEARDRVVQLLFDRDAGAGLSLYRYNIGAGAGEEIGDPWRRAETFETAPGEYDWGRDANAVWVLKAARAAGVEHFVAFANSPPARMTESGKVSGAEYGRSNLRTDMHDDFARYLVDVTRHLREIEGVPIRWISPINEPLWEWEGGGQEGCHYTAKECVAVTKALLRAIDEEGIDVEADIVEAPLWRGAGMLYVGPMLRDETLRAEIGHFSIHSYWSTREQKAAEAELIRSRFPDLRLWMSEWTEMKGGRDLGMDSALVMANVIHDDLTVASVTSWQYWIAVSRYDFRDGLIYVDEDTHAVHETKRLWTMAAYSRFVRPGYARVEATVDCADLRVSAFVSPDGERTVAIAINNGAEPVSVAPPSVGNGDSMTVYETSAAHDLATVYQGVRPAAVTLPAKSVSAIVSAAR